MADQRAPSWNYDILGDELPIANNDNVAPPPPDAYVAKNIDELKQSLIGGPHVGESQECVALVKQAIPEVGRAANWSEGQKIVGYNDPPLEPGTALATFKHGQYPNNSTGNHAGLFIGYGQQDGKDGFWLLDQSKGDGNTPDLRFKKFDPGNSPHTTSYAGNYSVIRRPSAK